MPTRYILCRVKYETPDAAVPTIISTHASVYADTDEAAHRLLAARRPSVVTRPKGRPPRDTVLQMLPEHVVQQHTAAATVVPSITYAG
jgi:hypothetical protein